MKLKLVKEANMARKLCLVNIFLLSIVMCNGQMVFPSDDDDDTPPIIQSRFGYASPHAKEIAEEFITPIKGYKTGAVKTVVNKWKKYWGGGDQSNSEAIDPVLLTGHKQGCTKAPKQAMNAVSKCDLGSGMCKVTCMNDYQFPNGETNLYIRCVEGEWTIKNSEWTEVPSCEPICLPVCQNNGICLSPGQCQCPDNFMGLQCQHEKKFCLTPPALPPNSKRTCTSTTCSITCAKGYKFADSSSVINMFCKDGNWKLSRPEISVIPECKPTCTRECENGGKCISYNICQCTQEFRGPQCQYSVENCSVKKLKFNGGYNCSGTANTLSCSLYCPTGINFDIIPAPKYSCNYSIGVFEPAPIPQCVIPKGVRIITSDQKTMYNVSETTFSKKKQSRKMSKEIEEEGEDNNDEDYEEITVTKKKFKKKQKNPKKKTLEWEEDYDESQEFPGVYNMYLSENMNIVHSTPKPAMCMTWNGNKIKTFDGLIYSAPIYCAHTLVQDRIDGGFSIVLRTCPYGAIEPCPHSIIILLQDKQYTLSNDKGKIVLSTANKELSLPIQISGIRVARTANVIRISMETIQTSIIWDTMKMVQIEASTGLWNKTLGLCGTMDNDMANDFMSKTGVVSKLPTTFTDSWKAESLNTGNELCDIMAKIKQPNVSCAPEVQRKATETCTTSLNNPKLTKCLSNLSKKALLNSCISDYCSCTNVADRSTCACDGISILAKDCQFQGVVMENGWRDLETCPMNCENGRIYKACGPAYEPSCGSAVENIQLSCQEGCFCPEGTILSNGKCIEPELCPCKLRNKQFKAGSSIKKDCNLCKCENGSWKCTTNNCGSRCSAQGDPHYITFDGKRYDFMGKCSYYLLKTDDLTVEAENVPCLGIISKNMNLASTGVTTSMPSCTKSVTMKFKDGDNDVIIKLKQDKIVYVDDKEVTKLPKKMMNGLLKIREASSSFLIVDFQGGIKVWWDGINRVYIDAPASYRGLTKGLCGTFNSNLQDDFLTPEGDIEEITEPFADKWKVDETCESMTGKNVPHPCQINVENKVKAEKLCSKIRSNVFDECHWAVDPEPFYEDCLYDVCACKDDINTCACQILAAYAAECSRQGNIVPWRYSIEECAIKCPAGQIYQQCGNACKRTSYDIQNEDDCKLECIEGCQCPDGQILDENKECIPLGTCPCTYGGLEFKPSYKEVRPGAKYLELCTCVAGKWKCEEAQRDDDKTYPPATDMKRKCKASENEEFTTCEPEEPVTCKNMHEPVQTSVAECRPGCVCKSGYVFDFALKKCVLPENCSCAHGGKSYNDGQKMSEDCNTCICKAGKWKCTTKECPSTCSAWGDSHFDTFDGKSFDFQGVCRYVLSKGTLEDGEGFSIVIQNVLCGSLGVTCSKSVQISILGQNTESITLSSDSPTPALVAFKDNDINKKLSINKLTKLIVYKAGVFTIIEAPDLGMQVKWDHGTRIYVKVHKKWNNKVQGLCGNNNGNAQDDLATPSSGIESSPVLFGHSWKLEDYCTKPTELIDACDEHPQRKIWSERKCNVLKSGAFKACHSVVPVENYIKRCVFDTCACDQGGDCECLCTALAAYAHVCAMKGLPIKWRTNELCPMQCDAHCSEYSPCVSTCPIETCDNLLDESKPDKICIEDNCVEGCQVKLCESGQIYLNNSFNECVSKSVCKPICLEKDGVTYYEGDIINFDECHTCTCSRGKEVCSGVPCSETSVSPSSTPVTSTTPKDNSMGDEEPLCISGWSKWINNDKLESSGIKTALGMKKGDTEPLQSLLTMENNVLSYCSPESLKSIECRRVKTNMTPKETGQDVECSLERGLVCVGDCFDFEIRLLCACKTNATTQLTTIRPSVSTTSKPYSKACSPVIPHVEYPGDCQKFLHCQPMENGIWEYVEKICGPGTLYNPKIMICDWAAAVVAIKPDCGKVEKLKDCPSGKVWSDCAVPCGKTCHHYGQSLRFDGNCKDEYHECKDGCVDIGSATTCPDGKLWRDNKSCVEIADCTCMSESGMIIKPGQVVKESACIKCQCVENTYICLKTDCKNDTDIGYETQTTAIPSITLSTVANLIETTTKSVLILPITVTPPLACDESKMLPLIDTNTTKLSDDSFGASSILSPQFAPQFSKLSSKPNLKSSGSWSPKINDQMQYLEIKLPKMTPLFGIIVSGSPMNDQYVTSFKILISSDGVGFNYLVDDTKFPQIFRGGIDSRTPVKSLFKIPVETKVVRVYPLTWHNSIAMRVELLGCSPETAKPASTTTIVPSNITTTTPRSISTTTKVIPITVTTPITDMDTKPMCDDDMGTQNGMMSPDQIIVSTSKGAINEITGFIMEPHDSLKLSSVQGWHPLIDVPNQFVMFNFYGPRNLTGIKTKGGKKGWVTAYNVLHSLDGKLWNKVLDNDNNEKIFLGNYDPDTVKTNYFRFPIQAKYLKIVPQKWHSQIELKAEVLGCYKPYHELEDDVEVFTVPTTLITKPYYSCGICPGLHDAVVVFNDVSCPCRLPKHWNGRECINKEECPCFVGHMAYDVGAKYDTEDCSECICLMNGVPQCKPKKCAPCKTGMKSIKTKTCECKCEACAIDTKLCPSSDICLANSKWCDGIQDCGDDEQNCETKIEVPDTNVEAPTCLKPLCPPGYKVLHKPDQKGPRKMSAMFEYDIEVTKTIIRKYKKNQHRNTKKSYVSKLAFPSEKLEQLDEIECPRFECIPDEEIGFTEEDQKRCLEEKCPKGYEVKREVSHLPNKCPIFTCEPIPEEDAVCNVTARTFNTFDGTEFKYDICSNVLARDLRGDKWSIILTKNCSMGNYVCTKELQINDHASDFTVKLYPDLTLDLDGYRYTVDTLQKCTLPKKAFKVSKIGNQILFVSHLHGIWVTFDMNGDVKVGISEKYHGSVDGLCGYFNGRMNDDKRSPTGVVLKSTLEFGDAWKTKLISDGECTPHVCPKNLQEIAFQMCNTIKDDSFKPCELSIDHNIFISKCMETACDCLIASTNNSLEVKTVKPKDAAYKCKCNVLQNFVTECLTSNDKAELDTWRTVHQCEASCPAPLVHRDCFRRRCEPSCKNMKTEECPFLSGTCFSGCYCPNGYIRNGETCIPTNECRDCVCDGFGKSQYVTYDRANFTFDGNCSYLLSRNLMVENVHTFQVFATVGPCEAATEATNKKTGTCTQSLHILYGTHIVHIQRKNAKEFEVFVDGMKEIPTWLKLTVQDGKGINILIPDSQLEITSLFQDMSFSIKVPSIKYGSKMEGLCGNCDGDITNELQPNKNKPTIPAKGKNAKTKNFVESWLADQPKLGLTEDKCIVDDEETDCVPLPPELDPCFKILDENLFGMCHMVVDPIMYISACQKDLCRVGPAQKGACESLAAYARECSRNGLCIDWRLNGLCPYGCPAHLTYNHCGCPATCDTIKAQKEISKNVVKGRKGSKPMKMIDMCHVVKTEGCYCPGGKVFHNGKCIFEKECTPCDDIGHYPGDIWYPDPCTTCNCGNDTRTICSKKQCSLEEVICEKGLQPVEIFSEDQCCKKFACVPKPETIDACPKQVLPECGPDQIRKASQDAEGCPIYICECKPPTECDSLLGQKDKLLPGQKIVIDKTGCCAVSKIVCEKSLCPDKPAQCNEFFEILTEQPTEEECCVKYKCVAPKDKCIFESKGKKYLKNLNDKWNTDDPCITKTCVYGKDGPQVVDKTEFCNAICEPGFELEKQAGQCCGSCIQTKCKFENEFYSPGDLWKSEDECINFTCNIIDSQVVVSSLHQTCPDISKCPQNLLVKKGCCKVCKEAAADLKNCLPQEMPVGNTIGLIRQTTYMHGKCKNKKPVSGFAECNGGCSSGTIYNPETSVFDKKCDCCCADAFKDMTIELVCDNGHSFNKTISVPTACSCKPCEESMNFNKL